MIRLIIAESRILPWAFFMIDLDTLGRVWLWLIQKLHVACIQTYCSQVPSMCFLKIVSLESSDSIQIQFRFNANCCLRGKNQPRQNNHRFLNSNVLLSQCSNPGTIKWLNELSCVFTVYLRLSWIYFHSCWSPGMNIIYFYLNRYDFL